MEKSKGARVLSTVVLLTILFSPIIGLLPNALAKELGSVHGTVIDENGVAFIDMQVTVHDSFGKILATSYTDDTGLFRFALYGGTYMVKIEMEGYVKVESSITVPDNAGLFYEPENDPVDMGVITLKKTLRLSSSVITRIVNPGDDLLLPFTVSNIGEKIEDVELSTYCSAGWATRILDQSGQVKRVYLTSGSVGLNLEVDVPFTAAGNYNVSLIAVGSTLQTLNFTIIVQERHGVDLESTYPYVSSEIGGSIKYPLTITNTGEMDETVNLVSVIPNGWTIRFTTSEKTDVLQIFLKAGQSEKLTVEATPSTDSGIGIYNITIKAVSEGDELRASLDLVASLRIATGEVEVISTLKEATLEAGKMLQVPIQIWNKGDKDTLTLLEVLSLPDNWKAAFNYEGVYVSQILVTAGEVISLKFEVTPPSIVDVGSNSVVFAAMTENGVVLKQIDLGVNIVGSYKLGLEPSTLYTTVNTGSSTSFTVKVTNTGQSPVTTLSLNVAAPDGWSVSVTPVQVTSLASKDSYTFNVVTQIPDSTVAGDYMVTLTAQSDQVNSAETQLRVTTSASTSWG